MARAVNGIVITKLTALTVYFKLTALTVYYSINRVNGQKNSLTVYKHRREHIKHQNVLKFHAILIIITKNFN